MKKRMHNLFFGVLLGFVFNLVLMLPVIWEASQIAYDRGVRDSVLFYELREYRCVNISQNTSFEDELRIFHQDYVDDWRSKRI